MAFRILAVDDEPLILKGLRFSLEQDGYIVEEALDGQSALDRIQSTQYDLVLLDVMLPVVSGTDVLRQMREFTDTPVIMLTAKGDDMDRILGLEYGADDYMVKPFNILEVKARIKSVLRRTHVKAPASNVIRFKNLTIDPTARSFARDGMEINLTVKEFNLLMTLAQEPSKVFSREQLHQALWKNEKADGKCSCDYSFHMSITDWNPSVSKEVQDMMDEGITSFKLYMTYDTQVDDKTLFEILQRLKETGGITGVHCENSGMIAALQEEAKAAGKMGVSSHPKTRPVAAEAEAIGRLLRLAEVADVPVVVVHLTCKEGYDVIAQARKRGQKVYVETCPQYLLMDDSLYELPGFESAKYVCAPPLRKKEDQDCLWKGLADGTIQTVSTDHCSFTTEQKKLGEGDFTKIPGGMPGAETRGTLIYTYGVDKGRITKEDMCRVLSENPAKLYGLYPRKGVIAPGSDADLVIMRTGVEDVITAKDQVQNVDYAPFEGTKVTGRVESVFLRGLQAVKDGKVVEEKKGEFLKRGKYAL